MFINTSYAGTGLVKLRFDFLVVEHPNNFYIQDTLSSCARLACRMHSLKAECVARAKVSCIQQQLIIICDLNN